MCDVVIVAHKTDICVVWLILQKFENDISRNLIYEDLGDSRQLKQKAGFLDGLEQGTRQANLDELVHKE
jgi:hypothetical protein